MDRDLARGESSMLEKIPNPDNYIGSNFLNFQFSKKPETHLIIDNDTMAHSMQIINGAITKFTTAGNQMRTTRIEIDDKVLITKILKVYMDEGNRSIFNSLTKPMTIQEILKTCKKPKSTIYRRISLLLKNGYLQISGYKKEFGKRNRSTKFKKTINDITIHMNANTNLIILTVDSKGIKTNGLGFRLQNDL
jgi:hypothetical protein